MELLAPHYVYYYTMKFMVCQVVFQKNIDFFQTFFVLKSKRGQRRSADLDFLSAEENGGIYADELDGVLRPRHHESGEAVKRDPRQPVRRYGVNDLEQV